MSTLVAPAGAPMAIEPSAPSPPAHDPSRILLQGLSWATFLRILDETGDRRRVRLAFSRGELELMSPGPIHEEDSRGFNRLIEIVCEEARVPFKAYGSTTWTRDDSEKGIEADECYYFAPEKISAARELSRQRVNDSRRYPRPDLVVEIDIRRSSVDRHAIYATLGIPELWSFADDRLRIESLAGDGTYRDAEASRFVPLPVSEITRWVLALDTSEDDGAWAREFRAWVRGELAKRV